MAYIYMIHFDVPLSHAQHYSGVTCNLKSRLAAHATGAGSRLCSELLAQSIPWRLGSLWQCNFAQMRRLERQLKDQHNGPEFCSICNPEHTRTIPGCVPYPVEMIRFDTASQNFPTNTIGPQTVRFTTADDPNSTMLWISDLMKKDRGALGFIPAGGPEGLNLLKVQGKIAIVSNDQEPVGYAAYTIARNARHITVHQACVADAARLMGNGAALIREIAARHPTLPIFAKVKDDLAANHFWTAIGFDQVATGPHKTSGNIINTYLLLPKGSKHGV